MATKTKTIKMLLYDGALSGVMNVSDSAWESGKLYAAPRESIDNLISRADCKKYGVYLLLSNQLVYVGQASDLERRTKQHLTDKDWWEQVVLLTTKDDSLNASDIDYLESRLIEIAEQVGKLDRDNKKRGNPQKVDEFRQAELEQYLEEALFLLELIGIKVLKNNPKQSHKKPVNGIMKKRKSENITKNSGTSSKPALPSDELRPGEFAKTALINLLKSGYVFSDELIQRFSSIDGSKQYTKRNLPMFWLLKKGESRLTCEKSIRERYWKEEFTSGSYRFLMYSQWYDDQHKGPTKQIFADWYAQL